MTECFSKSPGKCYTRVPWAALYYWWESLVNHAYDKINKGTNLSFTSVLFFFFLIFATLPSHFNLDCSSGNFTILQNNTFTLQIGRLTLHLPFWSTVPPALPSPSVPNNFIFHPPTFQFLTILIVLFLCWPVVCVSSAFCPAAGWEMPTLSAAPNSILTCSLIKKAQFLSSRTQRKRFVRL